MPRIVSGLWLVAVLLVLHGTTPSFEQMGFGQLDPIFDRSGPLAADKPASPPTVQPRAPVSTSVNGLRHLAGNEGLVPGRDAPLGLAAAPPTVPIPAVGERLHLVAGGFCPPVELYAFDARAPPLLA